ncbi:hypothetical protein [Streptomyces sp. NPDC048603]|uniref:hypothetical protein n=1 Tax=Streptomyces sp. NPDC048603 TaxID=3365577 RepID=UPI00372100FC
MSLPPPPGNPPPPPPYPPYPPHFYPPPPPPRRSGTGCIIAAVVGVVLGVLLLMAAVDFIAGAQAAEGGPADPDMCAFVANFKATFFESAWALGCEIGGSNSGGSGY